MFLESIASSLPRQSSSTDDSPPPARVFLSFPASQLNGHAWKEEEEKKEAVAEAAVRAACLLRREKLSLSLFLPSQGPKGRPPPPFSSSSDAAPADFSLSLPLSRPWKRRERRGKESKGSSLSPVPSLTGGRRSGFSPPMLNRKERKRNRLTVQCVPTTHSGKYH